MTLPIKHPPFRRIPFSSFPPSTLSAPTRHTHVSVPAKPAPPAFPQVNARKPVVVALSLYPAAEAWVRVDQGGRAYWVPGHASVVDVVLRVHGW